MSRPLAALLACLLGACASTTPSGRTAAIQRTANGVAHIAAPDVETLAYGIAYAHADDNACQTAQQLLTVRGERSRWFGADRQGLLGLRALPNAQSDFFVAAWMDDARLERAWAAASADAAAMARGYVAGWNRFLDDHRGRLPAACNGADWVRPMTMADYRRLQELTAVQAGVALLADAFAAQPPGTALADAPTAQPPGTALADAPTAQPPGPARAGAPTAQPPGTASAGASSAIDLDDARAELRARGLLDPLLGSNAWAFGGDVTANHRGLLLGNPHFPWVGVNRFWQFHATVPGRLDVMGAAIGHSPVVQIGFNRDVAWSHTVSTGKRFTLHELKLVPGEPTRYVVDGREQAMAVRTLAIDVLEPDGRIGRREQQLYTTRWGPVVVLPRAGLAWTRSVAYALQDANAGNARSTDTWLGFGRARNVGEMRAAMANLGIPWVNTVAADRDGNALYADASVVPDVDAARLERCAPSAPARALLAGAGIAVLDGSRADCDWRRDDAASPVPGLTPIGRMPVAIRRDWVANSNDSYVYTHWPEQRFDPAIGPLVGDAVVRVARTRAGMAEIPELLARGPLTPVTVQQQLFADRSTVAREVLPDLLAACAQAPTPAAQDGCAALRQWDGSANVDARGAHLFIEFWRVASALPGVQRTPFDPARPATTPAGLRMDDAAVAAKVWDALAAAVGRVRAAGFALDAPFGSVQALPVAGGERIPVHGGDGAIGVLNMVSARAGNGIGPQGLVPDYGTSYVQTVTFDDRGPVAQALLTYGQSSDPASPHAVDQLRLFSARQWPALPFHAADVERERVGDVLRLVMP